MRYFLLGVEKIRIWADFAKSLGIIFKTEKSGCISFTACKSRIDFIKSAIQFSKSKVKTLIIIFKTVFFANFFPFSLKTDWKPFPKKYTQAFILRRTMVAFSIFWFSIYRYGIFYAIAFLLGYLWLAWLGKQAFIAPYPRVKKILTDNLEDLILVIALWVILWGRGGHVLIYGNGYYFTHLSEIFKVREGGMSFIWGIIGVVIAISIFSRFQKLKKSDFLLLFDMILIFVPLWILLWRCGNFLNQELYGIPISELSTQLAQLFQNLGLTHVYTKIDALPRVNTNFLSMLLEWATIFIIQLLTLRTYLKTKKIKIWILSTNFLLYYSIIRFLLEYLRADSQLEFIWLFTKSQWFFILFILIAIVIKLFLRTQKEKNLN